VKFTLLIVKAKVGGDDYKIIFRKFNRIFVIIAGISCNVAICINRDRRHKLGLSWLTGISNCLL
jgi:hypothetical protein